MQTKQRRRLDDLLMYSSLFMHTDTHLPEAEGADDMQSGWSTEACKWVKGVKLIPVEPHSA